MCRIRIVLAAVLATVLLAAPAAANPNPAPPTSRVLYRAPVQGPIVDPFRPPSTPFGPGNRGVDYATSPGQPVAAPADGLVTFAGAVAGGLHVVVLHRDGIRTSLSFLAAVLVTRGQEVTGGQIVGLAGARLHFGARRGEVYLDPTTLLSGAPGGSRSVLVPEGAGRPLGIGEEAAGLRRLLAGATLRASPPTSGELGATSPSPGGRTGPEVGALVRNAAALGGPPAWAVLTQASKPVARIGPDG